MAAFGFSVGDFIATLILIKDVAQALNESAGSAADFRSLLETLQSLNQALVESEVILFEWSAVVTSQKCKDRAIPTIRSIEHHRRLCWELMDAFLKDAKPYTDALIHRRRSVVFRGLKKVTWLYHKEDAKKLEHRLQGHLQAIQIYKTALLKIHMDANLEVINSGMSSLKIEFSAISRFIQDSRFTVPSSLSYPWGTSPFLAENVLFLDALGRRILMPMILMSTAIQFHEVLDIMYRGLPGHRRIMRRQYSITNESSDGTLVDESQWNTSIHPGMEIGLNIVLEASPSWKDMHQCPKCQELIFGKTLPGERKRCQKCQLTFLIIDKERIVEELEDEETDEKTKHLPHPSNSKSETHPDDCDSFSYKKRPISQFYCSKMFERGTGLREEDYFNRIQYHREVKVLRAAKHRESISTKELTDLKVEKLPPLHRAAAEGDLARINLLLDSGESVEIPLPYQCKLPLLDHSTYVFSHPKALHIACWFGRTKAISLLLDRGADIKDVDGDSAGVLHYAIAGGSKIGIMNLMRRGANVNLQDNNGDTPLHLACWQDDPLMIDVLLSHGADINALNNDKGTPLHLACHFGCLAVVRMLLGNEAYVNAPTVDGTVPLHSASYEGRKEIALALIEAQADISIKCSEQNLTSLHIASWHGHEEVVKVLVGHGADVNSRDSQNATPLHDASQRGHLPVVKLLLSNGSDISAVESLGRTALHTAAYEGNEDVVMFLLEQKADVSSRDDRGSTPLHYAVNSNTPSKRIIEALLKYGSDSNAKTAKNSTILHFLCLNRVSCEESVKMLLEHGADISAPFTNGSVTIPPLCLAANSGHRHIVKALLGLGADVSSCDSEQSTALHYACGECNLETVRILLDHKASVFARDQFRITPLLAATTKSDCQQDIVELLVEAGSELDAQGISGWSPLLMASRNGNLEVVRYLISKGADTGIKHEDEGNVLHIACRYNHEPVVQLLVDVGTHLDTQGPNGWSPLMLASVYGSVECVGFLVNKGARVDSRSNLGATALYLACYCGYKSIAELLIEAGSDIEARDNDEYSACMVACMQGHVEVVDVLIAKRADLNAMGLDKSSALYFACKNGYKAIVTALIDAGSNIEVRDHEGTSPLSIASWEGHVDIVELLCQKGANLMAKDTSGGTALHWACFRGHRSVAVLLVHRGADLNAQINQKIAPLMLAAINGFLEIIQLLIRHGAHLEASDQNGWTALDFACSTGKLDCVKYLIKSGANCTAVNDSGQTALFGAARGKHLDVIECLLAAGSDPTIRDKDGKTYKDVLDELDNELEVKPDDELEGEELEMNTEGTKAGLIQELCMA